MIEETKAEMRKVDCARFSTEIDKDKVVIGTKTDKEIIERPKWDVYENNHFAMRKRLVSIFLRVANKVICRLRAGRRLQMIQAWIEHHDIKTRDDMR